MLFCPLSLLPVKKPNRRKHMFRCSASRKGAVCWLGVLLEVAGEEGGLLVRASSWSVPLFRCSRTGLDLAGNFFEVLRVQHDINSTVG